MWNEKQICGRPTVLYHQEDIPGAYTCYSLLAVIMCNLGPGHNNEVVGHEESNYRLSIDVVFDFE